MNLDSVKKVKRSKAFTALDCIAAAAIALCVAVSAAVIYTRPALTVTVTAPNYERTFDVRADETVTLDCLTVHISGGKVWVTDADCPDKTCVRTGVITRAGQSIVCLPNKVTVTISGESDLQWELGRA